MECPKKWELHYKQRLRPKLHPSPLLFGTAMDEALNALMLDPTVDVYQVFTKHWEEQRLNRETVFLPTCIEIFYSNADYDPDLLMDKDIAKLKHDYGVVDPLETAAALLEQKKEVGFKNLPDLRKLFLNHITWWSLYRKGLIMLRTIVEEVLPTIEKVISVQETIRIVNEDGDELTVKTDLVVKLKGIDVPVIMDWKTSSIEYEEDAVRTSPQLALYVFQLEEKYKTRKAGFFVIRKKILKTKHKICKSCKYDGTGKRHEKCNNTVDKKRCNGDWDINLTFKALIQTYVDDIPEETLQIVLDNIDYVNQCVSNDAFPQNFDACIQPWGKCPYYDLCHNNNSEDLVKLDEREKK